MADVTTYKRSTMSYVTSGGASVRVGDVRAASDPVVSQYPQWWIALTDAEFSDGKHGNHGSG